MRGSPASLITAVLAAVVLFCLAGYQVTSETAGVRLLGRVGAALIELDRWLPAHRDDIELLSRDRPDAPLVLPDLPIEVAVPSAVVLEASDERLRSVITRAMGERLYADGAGAVQDEAGESHLDFTEPVRWTIDLLGESAHAFWGSALILSTLLLLILCAGLLWTRHSPLPPLAFGGGIAAALSLAVWLLVQGLQSILDGAVDKEIALVLRDGAWVGLRNGLAVLAIAASLMYLLSTLLPRRDEWEGWQDPDDTQYPEFEAPRRQSPPY